MQDASQTSDSHCYELPRQQAKIDQKTMQMALNCASDVIKMERAYQRVHASYQVEEWVHGSSATAAQSWPEELPELQVSHRQGRRLKLQPCVPNSELPGQI